MVHAATPPYAACSRLQPGVAPSVFLFSCCDIPSPQRVSTPHASVPPSFPSHELLHILCVCCCRRPPPAAKLPLPALTSPNIWATTRAAAACPFRVASRKYEHEP